MAAQPKYASDFLIKINDEEIPAALRSCVTAVRYEDGVASMLGDSEDEEKEAADRVEIRLANPDLRWLQRHIRGLGFRPFPTGVAIGPARVAQAVPEGLFDLDNTVSLAMGYAGEGLEEMFLGDITGIEAEFPNTGFPTMKLVAHDRLHRLSRGKYARGFGLLPDFVIAAILSAENFLLPAIDPVVSAGSTAMAVLNAIFKGTGRKQKGQSDLELLREIAQMYDADFWVEGNVLYLSRVLGKEFTPRLTLTWGESLLAFAPRVRAIGQVVGVAVKFTLPMIPLDFLVTAAWDFDRESLVVTVVPGAAAVAAKSLVGGVLTVIDRPINNPADITASALFIVRMLRNRLNTRLTGKGSAVGDPRIRGGAVIRLEGLGPNFSGNYRVASATHTIDARGYRTDFTVRKEILP